MEQLNTVSPQLQEEVQSAATSEFSKEEGQQLIKVREKFGIFSLISLSFGGFFALLFYKAYMGINVPIFTAIIIFLLLQVMRVLTVPIKRGTLLYYLGALLLAISTALTYNEAVHFLNIIGILMLLDLSLLHQFYEDHRWDFIKHLSKMFGLIFTSIGSLGLPFTAATAFLKRTKTFKNDKARNVLLGIIIALPLLLILTALLSAADMLFSKMTKQIFDFLFSEDIIAVGFMVIFGFLACYCIIGGSLWGVGKEEKAENKQADASIAITFMALISVMYAVFCVIQIVYLFANGVFTLPEEFTFAEYARRGFFELLAVTIINIGLLLLCTKLFQESKQLKRILTFMTLCTYIMIASATYRMLLYIGAYHLTFLRLIVLLCLLIDALVLGGVITYVYRRSFPLFPYSVAVIATCWIVFTLAKPDCIIADYMIKQNGELKESDVIFLLEELSIDAAPIVLPYVTSQGWKEDGTAKYEYASYQDYYGAEEALRRYYIDIEFAIENVDFRDFNYSLYLAEKTIKKYPRD